MERGREKERILASSTFARHGVLDGTLLPSVAYSLPTPLVFLLRCLVDVSMNRRYPRQAFINRAFRRCLRSRKRSKSCRRVENRKRAGCSNKKPRDLWLFLRRMPRKNSRETRRGIDQRRYALVRFNVSAISLRVVRIIRIIGIIDYRNVSSSRPEEANGLREARRIVKKFSSPLFRFTYEARVLARVIYRVEVLGYSSELTSRGKNNEETCPFST